MNMELILNYLSELSRNNNREWYHAHKEEYQQANAEFESLIQELILRIGENDSSILGNIPKKLTFKLVRDTRFSRDKSPYNPCFRAHISSKGKLPVPVGYYIMIRPGDQSFLGGGLFADMFKDATRMVRFKSYFAVKGTALKNVPAGYDEDHLQAKYLKNKSWYLEYFIKDEELLDGEQFLDRAVDVFRKMKPFNDYLNKALEGFEMPQR